MYDKAGSVLRLEMVINEPEGFTVRKEVSRKGKKVIKWVDMLKGMAYLFRYKDVSLAANGRYLNALAQVDDPTDAIRTLDRITTRKQIAPRRDRVLGDLQLLERYRGRIAGVRISPRRLLQDARTRFFFDEIGLKPYPIAARHSLL
jgi:hypothetical protein